MKTGEKRLLAVIILLFLIFYLSHKDLTARRAGGGERTGRSSQPVKGASPPEGAAKAVSGEKKIDLEGEVDFVSFLSDSDKQIPAAGDDPFRQSLSSGLKFEGLIWDEKGKPLALINGSIFGIGDKVGNYKIAEITSEKVVLKKGTKELVLKHGVEE